MTGQVKEVCKNRIFSFKGYFLGQYLAPHHTIPVSNPLDLIRKAADFLSSWEVKVIFLLRRMFWSMAVMYFLATLSWAQLKVDWLEKLVILKVVRRLDK